MRPPDSTYRPWCLYVLTRPELKGVKKVVVKSFSEEEVRQIEKDSESVWSGYGLTEEAVARTKKLLTFEVVGEEDL